MGCRSGNRGNNYLHFVIAVCSLFASFLLPRHRTSVVPTMASLPRLLVYSYFHKTDGIKVVLVQLFRDWVLDRFAGSRGSPRRSNDPIWLSEVAGSDSLRGDFVHPRQEETGDPGAPISVRFTDDTSGLVRKITSIFSARTVSRSWMWNGVVGSDRKLGFQDLNQITLVKTGQPRHSNERDSRSDGRLDRLCGSCTAVPSRKGFWIFFFFEY